MTPRLYDVRLPLIIPYQELLGNYDASSNISPMAIIIPYQELLGNYDKSGLTPMQMYDYTIPRAIREL
mgnify:CR=1 FL=1